jgi:regulator of sigma D
VFLRYSTTPFFNGLRHYLQKYTHVSQAFSDNFRKVVYQGNNTGRLRRNRAAIYNEIKGMTQSFLNFNERLQDDTIGTCGTSTEYRMT